MKWPWAKPAQRAPAPVGLADVQDAAKVASRWVRARFDAADTTDDNRKHWAMADGLSADLAASPGVRRILRNRARYEVANNTYARGIVTTLAHDLVGIGPRLQMTGLNRDDARFVESEFVAWASATNLGEKLRTMRMARAQDGEGFAVQVHNAGLRVPVKLDLWLFEAEQCASSAAALPDPRAVDGIQYDQWGNPQVYDILRSHPGGLAYVSADPLQIPARDVLHFFIPERPGQRRGIPEITPALPLFAQLRRWTLAVLAAAETAADLAAILRTQDAASPDEAAAADAFERIEFERRAIMTLPAGWDITQMKAEHPNSTYGDVKREILNEISRCLLVPYNVAAGNSSGYNFSSGKLDFQIYFRSVEVDRSRMEAQVLEPVFAAWLREAQLIDGYLPQHLRMIGTNWAHGWQWPGFESIDPVGEAQAQQIRLSSLTTTLADEWARQGYDWEEKIEQIGLERKRMASLGLTFADVMPIAKQTAPQQPAGATV